MKAWKCEICGYVHEGEKPPDFCPVCGAGKEHFTLMTIVVEKKGATTSSVWRCSICDHLHQGGVPPDECSVCGAPANLFEPVADRSAAAGVADVERVVIVGAGIAGVTAAAEARKAAPEVQITLISKESSLPYYRLNLTRFLAGMVAEGDLLIQQKSWYDEQRIEWLEGEVVSILTDRREVQLHDGRSLTYDRLVLANGSHPFVPSIAGADRDGVRVLRTLDDARAILKRLKPGMRCVCIGGGLLGLETAGALSQQNVAMTVLEGQPWLLPRQLPRRGGEILQGFVEGQGVEVCCGVQVQEITGDHRVRGVRLAGGGEIPADLVIISAGVRPNSYVARQSDLKVKTGIIVDDRMFTSNPHVLAAGDVTEHRGLLYGIWPAGYAQGVVAGINAVGGSAEFAGMPPHTRLKVLDIDLFSIGSLSMPDASYRFVERQGEAGYRCLVCRDNRIVGAALVGDTALAALLTDAIRDDRTLPELPEIMSRFT